MLPQDYVYVPTWLLILLVFLASGAVQYGLVAAVKWADRRLAERERQQQAAKPTVLSIADFRAEQRSSSGGKDS
jgi:hypothetical protein